MGAKVSSEISSLSEGLSTDITAIWFLSRMRSHVCLEGGWTSITLSTDLADIVARLTGGLVPWL